MDNPKENNNAQARYGVGPNNSNATRPIDHSSSLGVIVENSNQMVGGSSSHQARPGVGVGISANDELKSIDNIPDVLGPEETQHLLFQGHENEHIARQFLTPDIGSNITGRTRQYTLPQSAPRPSQTHAVRAICVYCLLNLMDGTFAVRKMCGHFFHPQCFNALPRWVQEQDASRPECYLCQR